MVKPSRAALMLLPLAAGAASPVLTQGRPGPAALIATLLLALGAPVALAADKAVSQPVAVSPAPVVKARPQVPQFPADVKALGDRLWSAASPAVKAWVKQVAPDIAKGPGDPEALARAAVQTRWPNLRVAGAADALTFLADYDAAKTLQADIKRSDSLGDLSQELSLRI